LERGHTRIVICGAHAHPRNRNWMRGESCLALCLANCAFSDSRVSVVRRVALWQVYPARRCRRLHERGRFLGALASIGFLYARSGEHSVPVTSVIVALTCSAMAGALGYCSKRLAIRLRSIPTRAWDALILIALALFQVGCMASWLYAMWRDVQQDQLGAFAADLIPPLGAVRGLLLWLGYV